MILECSGCGQKNRVTAARLHETSRCGRCKGALGPLARPLEIGSVAEFDELVREARVPLLVDFWAQWCGPCRMAAPHVATTAERRAGRALVLKVDTEALPQLGARYQVRGIPNFVVLGAGGRVVKQHAGLVMAATMEQWLDQASA